MSDLRHTGLSYLLIQFWLRLNHRSHVVVVDGGGVGDDLRVVRGLVVLIDVLGVLRQSYWSRGQDSIAVHREAVVLVVLSGQGGLRRVVRRTVDWCDTFSLTATDRQSSPRGWEDLLYWKAG